MKQTGASLQPAALRFGFWNFEFGIWNLKTPFAELLRIKLPKLFYPPQIMIQHNVALIDHAYMALLYHPAFLSANFIFIIKTKMRPRNSNKMPEATIAEEFERRQKIEEETHEKYLIELTGREVFIKHNVVVADVEIGLTW